MWGNTLEEEKLKPIPGVQKQYFFKLINVFHLRYKASFQLTVVHTGVTSRGTTKSY